MKKVLVCTNFRANPNNPSCAARGSETILVELSKEVREHHLTIEVEASPCMGYCEVGPNVRLAPNGPFFHAVSTKKLREIIKETKDFLKE